MIPVGMLPHTVSVLVPSLASTDAYGNPRTDYDNGTRHDDVAAFVQPISQDEDRADGRDATINHWSIITNDDVLTALARVDWDGTTYEVIGDPATLSTPRGVHHYHAVLRSVKG